MTPPTPQGESTRGRILDLVQGDPGISKLEICDQLGLAWGTIIYELEVMKKSGLVRLVPDQQRVAVVPANLSSDEATWLVALRASLCRDVVAKIASDGSLQAFHVAKGLGVSRKVIRRHLVRLHTAGLIERQGERKPRYALRDAARRFFEERVLGRTAAATPSTT